MNIRSFQFYNAHIRSLLGTDLRLFELSVWIQAVAQALISVFLPIILYKLGLSIKQIITFYLLFNAIDVPFNLVAKRFIENFGAKKALVLAIISEIVYYFILFNLSPNWAAIFFLAFFLAIYDTFYWVAHVYMFAGSAHSSMKIKRDISTLNIIRIAAGIIAPSIGALILIYADYRTLIFIASLLMFSSLLPLSKMKHLVFKPEQKGKSFKEFFSHPYEKINFIFESMGAFKEDVESVIWPFFIFFAYQSIRDVSYIPTLIAITAIAATYFTGKNIMRTNIYRFVTFGAILIALFWVMRLNYFGIHPLFFVSVFLVALSSILIDLPLEVSIMERGKRSDMLSASTYLNMSRMGGRMMLYLILIFVSNIFRIGFVLGIVLVLIFALASWIVASKRAEISRLFPEPVGLEIEK